MTQPKSTGLSLEALLPAIQRLSAPQSFFLVRYIGRGANTGTYDAEEAVRITYPRISKSPKRVKTLAYQILNRRNIKKILALHFGQSDLELTLTDLRRLLKRVLRRHANTEKLAPPLNRISKTLATIAGEKSNGR